MMQDNRPVTPYEGLTILHIAILKEELHETLWLIKKFPKLLNARATGSMFGVGKPLFYGEQQLEEMIRVGPKEYVNVHGAAWVSKSNLCRLCNTILTHSFLYVRLKMCSV